MSTTTAAAPPELHVPQLSLAVRMKLARESADLEQIELAERTGISRRSIHNYEKGHSKPSRPVLLSWALATGVPLAWLTEGEMAMPCPSCGHLPEPHHSAEPPTAARNRCSSTFALVRSPGRRASDGCRLPGPDSGESYADVYRLPLPPV